MYLPNGRLEMKKDALSRNLLVAKVKYHVWPDNWQAPRRQRFLSDVIIKITDIKASNKFYDKAPNQIL